MNYQSILEDIQKTTAEQIAAEPNAGQVADYIPELARVDPDRFGMALCNSEAGSKSLFAVGDAEHRFSIQSISKLFGLTLVMRELGGAAERIWSRVGVEPSGNPFNSLVQLEYEAGVPRNPFINAGAIVVSDLLCELFDEPKAELLGWVNRLAGQTDIEMDARVAASEWASRDRNAALAHMMKAFGNLHHDVDQVLDLYFHMCAIAMSCRELAIACDHLVQPAGECPISPRHAKRVLALMLTCGFYDESGEFAFSVGLSGKSGVGGGIIAVLPRKYSVAVLSPRLNAKGNSHRGTLALRRLTDLTGASLF